MRIDQAIVSAIFILHIIFYIFVVIYIIRYKPKKVSYSTIEPRFETPLWRGTIIYLEDGQKSYNGKMDAIVYSESVFISRENQDKFSI
ncbi:hypothetical protein [Ammoniphilus sp. CFH 90114]|uniref:hypothetical protein n=1 Tax=Ammoniphilus sp. CFH 90114 TaxID=2493665 RepID=UPI00100FDF45|nr:hypothetical protein [Ammoniphilus sp. CFH 90114]RXT05717.1 hypothetical protein EIZ39_16540 [Ammoniphilus sp. CFH 90114]